jgi:hypothetical protein
MRHISTLIAALVVAPLAWILIAFGQERSAQAFAGSGGALHTADFVRPLVFLAAAGVLLGLIATLRFSPLGAVVAGVGYVAAYAALLIAPGRLLDLFTHNLSVAGHRADLSTPIRTGTTLLVGALLLVGVASVGRWRRWPRPSETGDNAASGHDGPLGADGLGLDSTSLGAEPDLPFRSTTTPRVGADFSGQHHAESLDSNGW